MQAALDRSAYAMGETLYMAVELSWKKWKLCFGDGSRARQVSVDAGDLAGVVEQVERAKAKFGLAGGCGVLSCYEAGRDGFWIHRWLTSAGIGNVVLDSSSIEVPRRRRSPKTDRLDGRQLLNLLVRWVRGERPFSVVVVPSEAVEDERRLHRERDRLVKERGAHRSRLKSLLATQGLRDDLKGDFGARLTRLKRWDGAALGVELVGELEREWARLAQVEAQLNELEAEQRRRLKEAEGRPYEQMRQLRQLCSIDVQFAWTLVEELFGWRAFNNRRELAGCVGLTPTPWGSGEMEQEQGISKSGNRRCRTMMIELSWLWLLYQPDSELSRWYQRRFGQGGRRQRRLGIVALARKLLVALWRYLETGELPAGAKLKAA